MKKLFVILLMLLSFSLVACGQTTGQVTRTVYVSGKQALAEGKTTQLKANVDATWTSSDESILTVDENGLVTAVGIGSAQITVVDKTNFANKTVHPIKVYPYVDPAAGVSIATLEQLKNAGGTTIKLAYGFGASIKTVIKELVAEFEEEYAEYGIKVEYDEQSGYDGLKEALVMQIQTGTAPTLAVGYPDHFAEYLVADGIVPLDPYIKSEEVGIWDKANNTWQSDYNFYADYLAENQQFDVNETFYGLPFNKSTEVLVYNKQFFERFELKVPETWAELESVAKQINQIALSGDADEEFGVNVKELAEQGKFIPVAWDSGSNLFITATRQWGGEYTQAVYERDGRVSLTAGLQKYNNPTVVKCMEYLQGLANQGLFNVPGAWEKDYSSDLFKEIQCILSIGSSAGVGYNVGGKCSVGVSTIPFNSDTNIKQVIQQGTNLCMFAQATPEQKLAGWLLIKYLLSPEVNAEFAIRTGYFPVSASSENTTEYQRFLSDPTDEEVNYQLAALVNKSYRDKGFSYFTDPAWAGSSKIRTNVGDAIDTILIARNDIRQTLAQTVQLGNQ